MKHLLIILVLTSCSTTSLMKRYVKRGGKIEQVERVVTVTDTIRGANGKDSIIYRTIEIECPEPIIETRWKTRLKYKFDSKRFKDSLRHYRILDKVKSRYDLRTHRTTAKVERNKDRQITKQTKSNFRIWWILIGLGVGFVARHLIQKIW